MSIFVVHCKCISWYQIHVYYNNTLLFMYCNIFVYDVIVYWGISLGSDRNVCMISRCAKLSHRPSCSFNSLSACMLWQLVQVKINNLVYSPFQWLWSFKNVNTVKTFFYKIIIKYEFESVKYHLTLTFFAHPDRLFIQK